MHETDCMIKHDHSDESVVFTQEAFQNWGYRPDGTSRDLYQWLEEQDLEELAWETRDADCIETADKLDLMISWDYEYEHVC